MGEHTHDSECELYSEACGCDSRHALKQQCDELAEALDELEQYARGFSVSGVYLADEIEGNRLLTKACAALAKYSQPEEAPELFPGTLEKLRDLGK